MLLAKRDEIDLGFLASPTLGQCTLASQGVTK